MKSRFMKRMFSFILATVLLMGNVMPVMAESSVSGNDTTETVVVEPVVEESTVPEEPVSESEVNIEEESSEVSTTETTEETSSVESTTEESTEEETTEVTTEESTEEETTEESLSANEIIDEEVPLADTMQVSLEPVTVSGITITVSGPASAFAEGTTVSAVEVEPAEVVIEEVEESKQTVVKRYKAFDINLMCDGKVAEPLNDAMIKVNFEGDMLIPDTDNEEVTVYYVDNDNEIEAMSTNVVTVETEDAAEVETVEMTTTHFSTYIVMITGDNNEKVDIIVNHYLWKDNQATPLFLSQNKKVNRNVRIADIVKNDSNFELDPDKSIQEVVGDHEEEAEFVNEVYKISAEDEQVELNVYYKETTSAENDYIYSDAKFFDYNDELNYPGLSGNTRKQNNINYYKNYKSYHENYDADKNSYFGKRLGTKGAAGDYTAQIGNEAINNFDDDDQTRVITGLLDCIDANNTVKFASQYEDPGFFTNTASYGKTIIDNYSLGFTRSGITYTLNNVSTRQGHNKVWSQLNRFFPLTEGGLVAQEEYRHKDETNDYNWFFGMRYDFTFKIGDYVGDMSYTFTGDDDLWVCLDGEPILDLGGIHKAVEGTVNVWEKLLPAGSALDYNAKKAYLEQKINPNDPDSLTNGDVEHTITVLYMERGGHESNCNMKFVMPNFTPITPELPPVEPQEPIYDLGSSKTATVRDWDERIYEIKLDAWSLATSTSVTETIQPVDIVLSLDVSTSMNSDKMSAMKTAIRNFIDSLASKSPESKVGIVTFGANNCSKVADLTELSSSGVQDLKNEVDSISNSLPGTPLNKGLEGAQALISTSDSANKYVLVATDGEPYFDNINDVETKWNIIREKANVIKNDGTTLMTLAIEISSESTRGKLAGIASEAKYAYLASRATDMTNILQSVESSITNGFVSITNATITDVIDSRFYPVKVDGTPLSAGENNGGILSFTDGAWKYEWTNQTINPQGDNNTPGWSQTIYVKAKEDFMGGNMIPTNGAGSQITIPEKTEPYPFDKPTVNVKLLDLKITDKEITLFKGEEVKPSQYIQELSDGIVLVKIDIDNTKVPLTDSFKLTQTDINELIAGKNGETPNGKSSIEKQYTYETSEVLGEFVYELVDEYPDKTDTDSWVTPHDAVRVGNAVEDYWLKVTYIPADGLDRLQELEGKDIDGLKSLLELNVIDSLDGLYSIENINKLSYKLPVGTAVTSKDPVYGKYTVNVVAGAILIQKTINMDDVDWAGGDPVFTFEVKKLDEDQNEYKVHSYHTLRFSDNGSTGLYTKSVAIEGLEKGVYTVGECETMRYKLASDGLTAEGVGNCPAEARKETDSESLAKFGIGRTIDDPKTELNMRDGKVEFENDRVYNNNFSDTDVVKNVFTLGGNQKISWSGDRLYNGGNDSLGDSERVEEKPESTPDNTPDDTPNDTPEVTPGDTPDDTPEVTPDDTPDDTPDVQPEVPETITNKLQSFNYQDRYISASQGNNAGIVQNSNSEWKIVQGLADDGSEYVSFESVEYPGYYLRYKGKADGNGNIAVVLEEYKDNNDFKKSATFKKENGLFKDDWSSFKAAYKKPGDYYIRHYNYNLYISKKDDSDLYKKDATFLITTKAKMFNE